MDKYTAINGDALLDESAGGSLRLEYILQRYRDVWVVRDRYPYLYIDIDKLTAYTEHLDEFPVFSQSMLYQNISRKEFSQRLASSLASSGLDAGFSTDSNVVVEGGANPSAHGLMYFNDPLRIGVHPFCASGWQYIYVNAENVYQRKFGELISVQGYSRPSSPHVDFDPQQDLLRMIWESCLCKRDASSESIDKLNHLIDLLFLENEKVLSAAYDHHIATVPSDVLSDYPAPVLTKYGRLTHGVNGDPRIEISFALLHYESSLRRFNEIKVANRNNDLDAAFRHGVYAIVAAAACVEAVGNSLTFKATGQHPGHSDRRTPLRKINESAQMLAASKGLSFNPLAPGSRAYDDLDELRVLRNSFMHAKELDTDIEPSSRTSSVFASVDESSCRRYLESLRLGISDVYGQLQDVAPPIVTRDNVKWLQNLEVP